MEEEMKSIIDNKKWELVTFGRPLCHRAEVGLQGEEGPRRQRHQALRRGSSPRGTRSGRGGLRGGLHSRCTDENDAPITSTRVIQQVIGAPYGHQVGVFERRSC